ncbi:MAG: class I SAM-dependent methyltransferase [Clostridiales bacterium]|nr:class I SAM-dependent methyltransferase [Clostridiales bacterium]
MKKYLEIVNHYEQCLKEHGDNHKGVDWPNLDDALKRYRVMLELIKPNDFAVTLLDVGCGTAMFNEYLQNNNQAIYSGLDISNEFIKISKQKFPQNTFYEMDILDDPFILPNFDYIVMNGVFTEKQNLSFEEMFSYFRNFVMRIFPKSNIGIAFNVMSKAVDWERDDLFHLSADELISFVTKELSRNFIIRNDYGLYEYTMYLYH